MAEENLYDKLRNECHDKAFDCFGYSYIFEKKALRLRRWVTLIKAFGVLVPSLVGITALGYGYDNQILKNLIVVAIPLTLIQFIISLWAIIYKWDDELSYSYEAKVNYDSLYEKFKQLGKFPPNLYEELRTKYDLISVEYSLRSQQDAQHSLREWELRKGMKYSLREHKKECYGCKIIPLSMKSTDCYVCGNFSFKYQTYKS
ncbi:MAG: putative rane protein [Mucilaginibacter sp.]|nr:putative rane protein [Mucilaginibacter sp.]